MKIESALKDYYETLGLPTDKKKCDFNFSQLDKDSLLRKRALIAGEPVTLISTFYNEVKNVIPFYLECRRLSRILNVKEMLFVQNGSTDDTEQLLYELAAMDDSVKILVIKENQGYGYGFKAGLRASQSELVLLNHSDCQFDAYAFFTQHFQTLLSFNPENDVILPVRQGRTLYAHFRSSVLRWFAFFLLKQASREFNGQPKLFLKKRIGNIDTLPNNFSFDIGVTYRLLTSAQRSFFPNTIELPRFDGKSSWSTAFSGQIKLTGQYLGSIIRFRKNKGG